MRKLKKLLLVTVIMMLSVILFACDDDEEDSSTATKITMYMYQPEDWAVEYINRVKADFNNEYKDQIKIDIRFYYGSQFYSN